MTPRKRFYKSVSVTGDYGIALDGRVVKTPLKSPLRLPTQELAEAVAAEWAAQGEKIAPSTMLFTKLANTAIDRVAMDRSRIVNEILEYAGSDLVCYRANEPEALVRRQRQHWDPVIDWARTAIDAPIETQTGIVHRLQPAAAIAAIEQALSERSDFEISAFYTIMAITGSGLIALMLAHGAVTPEAGWLAAHIDEDFQIETWGHDAEAAARRIRRHTEYLACCRFMALAWHAGKPASQSPSLLGTG